MHSPLEFKLLLKKKIVILLSLSAFSFPCLKGLSQVVGSDMIDSSYSLFTEVMNPDNPKAENTLKKSKVFHVQSDVVKYLQEVYPHEIEIEIDIPNSIESWKLILRKSMPFSENARIQTASGKTFSPNQHNLYYHGEIEGRLSLVSLTILKEEVYLWMIMDNESFRIIPEGNQRYIGFFDSDRIHPKDFSCQELIAGVESDQENEPKSHQNRSQDGGCVNLYIEADYTTYQDNGSSLLICSDFVALLFNEVQLLYSDLGVNIFLSDLFIWDVPDPYISTPSMVQILDDFGGNTQNTFDARLAHFISTRPLGGGVAWVDVLCSDFTSPCSQYTNCGPYGLSAGLDGFVVPIPDYSWNVNVLAHELGHNFGSMHTHDCVWNGNNTQIDDCGPEWNLINADACYDSQSPVLPEQGTIMSYCHLIDTIGIDFIDGFGAQPGALILANYNAAPCNTCGSNLVPGCMDPGACNFDPQANQENNTCEYISCSGCMDSKACNFDPLALVESGCCILPESNDSVVWDITYGGTDYDHFNLVIETSDGGLLVGGYSTSGNSGNKGPGQIGGYDFWVVKLDSLNNEEWQGVYGGTGPEILTSMTQVADGGYLLGGYAVVSGGTSTQTESSEGDYDFWIIKISASGTHQWDEVIGGSSQDELRDFAFSESGDLVLGGWSNSGVSGDKTEAGLGGFDYWVVQLDTTDFSIGWQKTLGGAGYDDLFEIVTLPNNEVLAGGFSDSGISTLKSEASVGMDYWVLKLDSLGNTLWEETIGSDGNDQLRTITPASDGGFILAGSSNSGVSADKTQASYGEKDYWVVRVDSVGQVIWDVTLGGGQNDELSDMVSLPSGGFVVCGFSSSGISGSKTEEILGLNDYWLVKINELGAEEWQNSLKGNDNDRGSGCISLDDGDIVVVGESNSTIGEDKSEDSYGDADAWIVKTTFKGEMGCMNPSFCNYNPEADCEPVDACFFPCGLAQLDTTILCNESYPPANSIGFLGGCTLLNTEALVNLDDCDGLIQYVYTLEDSCLNAQNFIFSINIVDSIPPVWDSFESLIEVPCDIDLNTIGITAMDNCGASPSVTYEDFVQSLGCNEHIIRTYTATDNCGNESQALQTINLIDTVAPQFINFPSDQAVVCQEEIPDCASLVLQYSDNCTPFEQIILVHDSTYFEEGECPEVENQVCVWTITDQCGNSTSRSWRVEVNTGAQLSVLAPNNQSIFCYQDLPPLIQPTVTSDCQVTSTFWLDSIPSDDGCPEEFTLINNFQVTDGCNMDTVSYSVSILRTDPVLTCLNMSDTISFGEQIPEPSYYVEDCSNVTVQVTDSIVAGLGPGEFILYREYTAEDDCGNVSDCEEIDFISGPNTLGCTDIDACNYSPEATIDSGNCTNPGTPCDDGIACTYNDTLNADCLCVGSSSFSVPTLDWACQLSGLSGQQANAITYDASGNVIVGGYIIHEGDACDMVNSLSGELHTGATLAKYDATGTQLWSFVALGEPSVISDVEVDSDGNVYVIGYFQEGPTSLNVNPLGTTLSISSNGNGDVFIAKYTINGICLWAQAIGGSEQELGNDISLDEDGNVYLAAMHKSTFDIASGNTLSPQIPGGRGNILAKYNTNGIYQWGISIGGPDDGASVFLEHLGAQLIVTGRFEGTQDFDPSPVDDVFQTSVSSNDVFIARYTEDGSYLNSFTIPGTDNERSEGIVSGPYGSVVISGLFNDQLDLDNDGIFELTSFGGSDIFLASYNLNNDLLWYEQIGGADNDRSDALYSDAWFDIYIGGSFQSSCDFNGGLSGGVASTTAGLYQGFVAKYGYTGSFQQVMDFGGDASNGFPEDEVQDIQVGPNGEIYFCGYYQGEDDFDPSPGVTMLTGTDGSEFFFGQLSQINLGDEICDGMDNDCNDEVDEDTCLPISGCTELSACNYNPGASIEDGSCEYVSCVGCTDSFACNFSLNAVLEDGSCIYPDGCADSLACNYDPLASCSDDSCEYESCAGCTDPLACNYDSSAILDDASCIYVGSLNLLDEQVIEIEGDINVSKVRTADMNNDGFVDIVCGFTGRIAWYENDGNGGFSTEHVIALDIHSPEALDIADVDLDGDLDLAIGSGDDRIMWIENFAGGLVWSQNLLDSAVIQSRSIKVADIDSDGDMDVCTVLGSTNDLRWYENQDSLFSPAIIIGSGLTGIQDLLVKDLVGDALPEIVVCGIFGVSVFNNDGLQNFSESSVSGSNAYMSILAYDITTDGMDDLILSGTSSQAIAWMENTGAIFNTEQAITTPSDQVTSIEFRDLNLDGLDDIVAFYQISGIGWHQNMGGLTYQPFEQLKPAEFGSMAVDYIDADSHLDLISSAPIEGLEVVKVCEIVLGVEGCTDPLACNFDQLAICDDLSCVFTGDSCNDGNACSQNDAIDGNCNCGGEALCPGDLNLDCQINTSDLLAFLSNFSCTMDCPLGDFNDDGVVNTTDLLSFLSWFGTSCLP